MLSVQNLSIELYQDKQWKQAVRPLSFEMKKGEITGIIGESGSGKSLLAKAIMNILPERARVCEGAVFLNDFNLLELTEQERRSWNGKRISYIFQNPASALNPLMTIGQQLLDAIMAHAAIGKKEATNLAKQALTNVGIADPDRVYRSYPHEISGGMKQRAVIAISVVHQPDLIIADEATTALDATIRKQILDLFLSLRNKMNISILYISHDMAAIKYVSDQILVLYGGHLLEYGGSKALLERPIHPYTEDLLRAVPYHVPSGERLQGISGQVPPITQIHAGCVYADRCKFVTEACRQEKPQLQANEPEKDKHQFYCHYSLFNRPANGMQKAGEQQA